MSCSDLEINQRVLNANEFIDDGEYKSALIVLKKLIKEYPRSAVAWLGYGCAAMGLGQISVAEAAWQTAKEMDPRNPRLWLQLAHNYNELRQLEKARIHYEEAAALDPKAIDPRISLALLKEREHRLDAARLIVDECLTINKHDEQAMFLMAKLSRLEGKYEEAEKEIRRLLATDVKHEFVRYAARYELAEILDVSGRYDEAMLYLVEAKKMVSLLANPTILVKQYDIYAEKMRRYALRQPRHILSLWGKTFPSKARREIPRLAFVGGHPRSGTTLLGRVMGAHPKIKAIDEPRVTEIAIKAVTECSFSIGARLNVARREYIDALVRESDGEIGGRLLLEKNPSPTLNLPFLLRVFPELLVIVAIRDPRDVVLSCFFQNIPLNLTNVNFLSFERLAKHYSDLMDVWLAVREWPGFNWIETRYENVVQDLESEGRRVTKFIGLQWAEAQSRYYQRSNDSAIFSPSYHNVRQPIYARSTGRWRNYEKYVEHILPALEPYCRQLGYQ